MLTVLPLTSFNAKVPLFSSHSPTLPLHLHFYPGSPPPPPQLLAALLFPPSFARANCAAQWQLADLFSSDGGKRISSFVSASLCVQSHYCTMDWEWMLGFVNNNLLVLHIKSISFWKIWRCTCLWTQLLAFYAKTMCKLENIVLRKSC